MARKRLWRKMSALELAVFESGETVRPLPNNITASSKNSFGAVSYTHLRVYQMSF